VRGFDSLPSHTFVINDLGGDVAKNVASQLVCDATKFINPHRLFHGEWLPQWLEERSEVSEKAKKLYAYLTYFAGGKGYAWPSFKILADKLHCSRHHVVRLVQELSAHRLITVTNVSNPERGHCANYYRFLWPPLDADRARREFRFCNARKRTAR
jgi:Helix-turn-helix domain